MNKLKIPLIVMVALMLLLGLYTLLINAVTILEEQPFSYDDYSIVTVEDTPASVISYPLIKKEKYAVDIAKAAIKSIYDEDPLLFLHGPYHVFFDQEEGYYYVYAYGVLFHPSVCVIVDAHDGSIVFIDHFKF